MRKWLNGKRQKVVLGVTLVGLAGLVAGVGAVCVGPAEGYVASGWVLTDEGEGIASVVLSFEPEFGIAASDYGGAWSKAGLRDEVTISPAKPGWEFNPEQVNVTEDTAGINFTGTFVDPLVLAGDYIVTGQFWLPEEEEPEPGTWEGSFTLHVGPRNPKEFEFYKTALEGTSEGFLLDHPELGLIETGPISLELDPDPNPELVLWGWYNVTTWEFEMVTPLLITIESLDPNPFPAKAFEKGILNPAEDHYASAGYITALGDPLEGTLLEFSKTGKKTSYEIGVGKKVFISCGEFGLVYSHSCEPPGIVRCQRVVYEEFAGLEVHGLKKGTANVTIMCEAGQERWTVVCTVTVDP